MSIETKRNVVLEYCSKHSCVPQDGIRGLPECMIKGNPVCNGHYCVGGLTTTDEEAEILFGMLNPDATTQAKPAIKDSGNRRTFESGAVRDMGNNGEKGRCDLLPLDIIGEHLTDIILLYINEFQRSGKVGHLYDVLAEIPENFGYGNSETMFLELAKHFAEGALKYGEYNWQKGLPVSSYIDSGVRHYLKHKRGDKDEPHDRAFCWNIVCAIWTCEHKPELNGYAKGGEDHA